MAIEITSLFRDILESPEQKQQRQMAEGFARSQNAVSQLTGLATAAAPLVGTMAELQGRRTEALQRGVGGLLGRDVRSTSEKLQEALGQFNPQDPASVSRTAQMLQQMGLGAQAAQLSGMALEEQQRKTAMSEETALRGQQAKLNTAAITRANQVNTDATQTATDRASFRTQAVQAITASDILNASEKETLRAQVAAGGFDGNAGALYEITSPKPIKIGDQLVQKGANGQWTTVTDTTGPSIRTTLQASANIQYGNNPTALAMISDGIRSGAITDAKQFDALAPIPKAAAPVQPSPQVELFAQAGVERGNAAESSINRINSILAEISADGGLMDAPAGVFSDLVEGAKGTLGLRDNVSAIRTQFNQQLNADIIAALPKGSASDKDVMLFARGYPPENASVAEIASYLEAAKSVMHKVQNFETISSRILSEQYNAGMLPTTIGLEEKAAPAIASIKNLDARTAELQWAVNEGALTGEDATKILNSDISEFQKIYNFIPSQFSR
jgi:hypothetical protein